MVYDTFRGSVQLIYNGLIWDQPKVVSDMMDGRMVHRVLHQFVLIRPKRQEGSTGMRY